MRHHAAAIAETHRRFRHTRPLINALRAKTPAQERLVALRQRLPRLYARGHDLNAVAHRKPLLTCARAVADVL